MTSRGIVSQTLTIDTVEQIGHTIGSEKLKPWQKNYCGGSFLSGPTL
jgi:hypothetical protein